MTNSRPVRCPACRREHVYVPPEYPCSCGAPVSVPVRWDGAPAQIRHRSWEASWAQLDCPACGRSGQWPQPEFDCPCGVTVRLSADRPEPGAGREESGARPPFQPLTIRTGYDAVACAAQFLRWLGFRNVRTAMPRPESGVDLHGAGVVGLVDTTTEPTGPREIETLWMHGLLEPARAVAFSLAGYDRGARVRADELRLPLFVLDLTGTPQPVNDPAAGLLRDGAGTD
ncbi:hypothetical protein ACWD33_10690 [Streptomyces xiamenensis]|uniref:hypothetical protein n=1 Tax=Streptomyces TaxID=1883 RepID=UPI0004C916E0|nr:MULTISPECIES: hypothetical protein [Streptomyces]